MNPDTDPSDLSSDVQTLPDHAPSEHESEPDNGSESDSNNSAPIIPRRSASSTLGHTSSVLWAGTDKEHYNLRL